MIRWGQTERCARFESEEGRRTERERRAMVFVVRWRNVFWLQSWMQPHKIQAPTAAVGRRFPPISAANLPLRCAQERTNEICGSARLQCVHRRAQGRRAAQGCNEQLTHRRLQYRLSGAGSWRSGSKGRPGLPAEGDKPSWKDSVDSRDAQGRSLQSSRPAQSWISTTDFSISIPRTHVCWLTNEHTGLSRGAFCTKRPQNPNYSLLGRNLKCRNLLQDWTRLNRKKQCRLVRSLNTPLSRTCILAFHVHASWHAHATLFEFIALLRIDLFRNRNDRALRELPRRPKQTWNGLYDKDLHWRSECIQLISNLNHCTLDFLNKCM